MSLKPFYLLCLLKILVTVESKEVRTTLGRVRGKLVDDEIAGAYYYSFEGIPYAEPPVGNLRFKPPVRKRPWSSVFDATIPGCVCPQPEGIYKRKQMDENCLIFNIYAPANCFNNLRPVVFVIHGGDFDSLSGNAKPIYGPQLLIRQDLIVVTMNYRLGALGFLSLCTEEVSGNAGLKDVLLVLKIVHENIARFGGDPNKITIMGNGAGAAMAELVMLTKQSIGLFRSVILHSGSVLSTKYLQIYPRENALLLARELRLNLSNNECLIDGLREASAFEIVEAQEAISRKDPQRGFRDFKPFKPTVEINCGSAVLTRPPLELIIREGAICDVPMLIGFNDQEGVEIFKLLKKEPKLIDKLNQNFELLIPSDFQYPFGSVERKKLATCIREFYFNGGNISFVNVQNYVDLISDAQYTFSIDFLIRLYKAKKSAPVYYYIFTADTELNWFKCIEEITYPGAAHFDDIGYVFLTQITEPKYECLDPITKHIQENVLLNLKYFIYYGAPTPNPNVNYWPETGKEGYHVIQDYDTIAVFHRPLPERIRFWNTAYNEYFSSKYNRTSFFCSNNNIRSIIE